MASEKQVAANRRNGLKGGVKTEEGKAVSRLNARKHSIFVTALTAEDSDEVRGYEDDLIASLRPAGRIEEMLVEKIALTWLRMQRCARAEAEYHIYTWKAPNPILDDYAARHLEERRRCGARAVPFNMDVFERMVRLIDLYDARLTNQFLKLLHEIERLQLMRKGENGAATPEVKGESRAGAEEVASAVQPPAESVNHAPAPAATQTTSPPTQPPSFVPSEDAAQPPEQAPAPAIETSQDAAGQRVDAPETI